MRFPGHATKDRDAAIQQHLSLVHSVARRYSPTGRPMDELIRVGTGGLAKAVDDPGSRNGLAFWTHALRAIDDEIRSYVQERGASDPEAGATSRSLVVRIPENLHAELIRAAQRQDMSLDALITDSLARTAGRRDAEGSEPGSFPERPRWTIALAANFVIVAVAALIGIALLVVAIVHGI
jgi:hypothetical protein